ncbi:hypothetical protein SNL152K_5241 [Streptomyces sp. NL15-2K]|nr:hypothetical protein SNL152K_5241 [Streptomyces sp. NL15-2K]
MTYEDMTSQGQGDPPRKNERRRAPLRIPRPPAVTSPS